MLTKACPVSTHENEDVFFLSTGVLTQSFWYALSIHEMKMYSSCKQGCNSPLLSVGYHSFIWVLKYLSLFQLRPP